MKKSDRRLQLADDLRRVAGLLEACRTAARRLRLPVPPNLDVCLETLREWSHSVRSLAEGAAMSPDEPTCQDSCGPRNDKQCSACGDRYGSEEEPKHPHLCPYCASVIDRETKAKKEGEGLFNWFE